MTKLAFQTQSGENARRLTSDYETLARDLLLVPEAAIIAGSGFTAAHLLTSAGQTAWIGLADGSVPVLAMVAVILSLLIPRGVRPVGPSQAMPAAPKATVLVPPVALMFGLTALIGGQIMNAGTPPASFMLLWAALAFPFLQAAHILLNAHIRHLRRNGTLRERVAVVWCGEAPDDALDHFPAATRPGIEVVGMFHASFDGRSNYPTINDLTDLARRAPIDRVLVITKQITSRRLREITTKLRTMDAEALLCFEGAGYGEGPIAGSLRMELVRRPLRGWDRVVKSAEDRLIALAALPLALPVMALCAIAIRLDSPGPILFSQTRHGRNNADFQVLKFRTMAWQGAARGNGARQTEKNDPRVTRVGRILRAASLDELPQIFNVLRGDMSIVGPRPHPVAMRTEDRLGEEITPEYLHRHRVNPGLTGLAQINGSRGALETAEQVRARTEFDLRYIENWSLGMDLEIIAMTPLRLVKHNGRAF